MTRAAACLAVCLVLSASGCASMRAGRARTQQLRAQLDELRYARQLDDVWQEVRRLLADRDYPLAAADAKAIGRPPPGLGKRLFSAARETRALGDDVGLLQKLGVLGSSAEGPRGLTLETDWRRSSERYRADAIEEAGGVRAVLTRFVNDGTDREGKPSRDLELELELARRVDPEAAVRIEAALAGPAR